MTVIANQVAHLLFADTESPDDLPVDQLQTLAGEYPYFTPLHFLLAAKDSPGSDSFSHVYNKALLYFPHAIQLNYLLHGGGEAKIIPGKENQAAVTSQPEKEQPGFVERGTTPENISTGAPVPTPEPIPDVVATPVSVNPALVEGVSNEITDFEDADATDLPPSAEEQEDTGPEIIIPGLKIEAIDPKTAELNLTPVHMHTVDYFASLGIKFKEQDRPLEKFDRQLKSFTDWLKVIKKVPDNQPYKTTDTKAEQKVEEMAGLSLKNDKIITETMAEVWAKQGNTAKAMEVYQKLSLLDPAKSAYFASRIENLKKSN